MSSTVDKLRERKKKEEALAEALNEQYATSLNGVATTDNGKFFLRTLIAKLGVFKPVNPKGAVDEIVLRNVYLRDIRPYLDDEVRKDLEQ